MANSEKFLGVPEAEQFSSADTLRAVWESAGGLVGNLPEHVQVLREYIKKGDSYAVDEYLKNIAKIGTPEALKEVRFIALAAFVDVFIADEDARKNFDEVLTYSAQSGEGVQEEIQKRFPCTPPIIKGRMLRKGLIKSFVFRAALNQLFGGSIREKMEAHIKEKFPEKRRSVEVLLHWVAQTRKQSVDSRGDIDDAFAATYELLRGGLGTMESFVRKLIEVLQQEELLIRTYHKKGLSTHTTVEALQADIAKRSLQRLFGIARTHIRLSMVFQSMPLVLRHIPSQEGQALVISSRFLEDVAKRIKEGEDPKDIIEALHNFDVDEKNKMAAGCPVAVLPIFLPAGYAMIDAQLKAKQP